MLQTIRLHSFLKLAYPLDYNSNQYAFNFQSVNKNTYFNAQEEDLIRLGVQKLIAAIEKNFESNKNNVVPLSGGLDSRAILGGLMLCCEVRDINTYTFGTPGTLDYDIGNLVAKKTGTNHMAFPLTEYGYSMDELLDISRRIDHQTVLFHHPPVWKLDKAYGDGVIWSGFMGDPLAGSHLGKKPYTTLDEVKKNFVEENTYVKSIRLDQAKDEDFFDHIETPNPIIESITLKEQIDFHNRQLKYVVPHVLMKGYQYKTPFLDSDWSTFILSVDDNLRRNQYLYKKIVLRAFPEVFKYPTKTTGGARINAGKPTLFFHRVKNRIQRELSENFSSVPAPHINYLDFNKAIRERDDLRTIIHDNIMDLKSRGVVPWIDIDGIWNRHLARKKNHADALLVLASLEIHLKSEDLYGAKRNSNDAPEASPSFKE